MDPTRKPHFRFYPGAYNAGGPFAESSEPCDLCNEPCGQRYTGSIYGEAPPAIVCAACIHAGRLGDHLHDVSVDGARPELEVELLARTPGVVSFNPFPWPVIDGVPLAFIGYGDDEALQNNQAASAAVIDAATEYKFQDFTMPTPYALIFKQTDGARHVAVIDMD